MLVRIACLASGLARRTVSTVVQPANLRDIDIPKNEPILGYLPDSAERKALKEELENSACKVECVPIMIGGEAIYDGQPRFQVMPHNHETKIAQYFWASEKTILKAIDVAAQAQILWDRTPLSERIAIWMRAADLMAGQFRSKLVASTMLGQSKTVYQAEIDAACELIDFFRFNAYFLKENARYQPISVNPNEVLNSLRFRGIEGFMAAISPFNFTAIAGNLAYTPALMGNAVLWKPSDTAILSNWTIFKIMKEAGLPDGVVNFVPAEGPEFGNAITKSHQLSGINFTGSVPTFNWLWTEVGKNINNYRNYPRLIGECGGKNYHFVHPSADITTVVSCTIRSAFEYCGQKCSACSRLYVPKSLRDPILNGLISEAKKLKVGDVMDFSVFMGAVIDEKAYARITNYISEAEKNPMTKIQVGGEYDGSCGYFVQPTIIEVCDWKDKLMTEEIFGPVLAMYVYDDQCINKALERVGSSTKFALTGAIFGTDQDFLCYAYEYLRNTAGNFYINDKSTGAVVGQQPFGGGRMSGTNDKAGGPNYVMRFTSPQSVKECFVPLKDISYPYMKES